MAESTSVSGEQGSQPMRVRLARLPGSYPGGWADSRAAPLPLRISAIYEDDSTTLHDDGDGDGKKDHESDDQLDTGMDPQRLWPPPDLHGKTSSEDMAFAALTKTQGDEHAVEDATSLVTEVDPILERLQSSKEEREKLLALRGTEASRLLDAIQLVSILLFFSVVQVFLAGANFISLVVG
jgi:hypothetical protein